MIVYFKGLNVPYVAAIDIEHDQGHMIQFAGILLRNVGEELYLQFCQALTYIHVIAHAHDEQDKAHSTVKQSHAQKTVYDHCPPALPPWRQYLDVQLGRRGECRV